MRRHTSARPILPVDHLIHEADACRFRHADLAALEDRELWAERVLVDQELARLIYEHARPRWFDHEQSDQGWLAARSGRLRDELAKRRAARGRHAA